MQVCRHLQPQQQVNHTDFYLFELPPWFSLLFKTAKKLCLATLERHCTENLKQIFPEIKLCGLFPSSYIHEFMICERFISLIESEVAQLHFWEYINRILFEVHRLFLPSPTILYYKKLFVYSYSAALQLSIHAITFTLPRRMHTPQKIKNVPNYFVISNREENIIRVCRNIADGSWMVLGKVERYDHSCTPPL